MAGGPRSRLHTPRKLSLSSQQSAACAQEHGCVIYFKMFGIFCTKKKIIPIYNDLDQSNVKKTRASDLTENMEKMELEKERHVEM